MSGFGKSHLDVITISVSHYGITLFLGDRIREHAELVVQSELGSPSDGRGGEQFD